MIREALLDDWPAISDVSRRSGYEDYINRVGKDFLRNGTILVLDENGILGFLKMEYLPDGSAWLGGLRVDPDYWRRGVGSRLTASALELAASRGCPSARLLIYDDNFRSLGLAEKQGFQKIGKFDFYEFVPDLSGFSHNLTDAEGVVNLGWKFARATGASRIPVEEYSNGGWKILSTESRTFQIRSIGDKPITMVEGGFTCISSEIGNSPYLEEYRNDDFTSGYVLEKKLQP